MTDDTASASVETFVVPKSAKEKRQAVVDLLLSGDKLSDGAIAAHVGVSRRTVLTIRNKLHTQGTEVALADKRAQNGSESRYKAFWKRVEELKAQYKSWGARNIMLRMRNKEGWSREEMPAVSSVERYLSAKELTHKHFSARTDKRPYWTEDYYKPMVRVGMDVQIVAPYKGGKDIAIVTCIDFWSRACYSEAFPYRSQDAYLHGINPERFAQVFFRFCWAFGPPEVLVLDNGAGQITQAGWLPEIARLALSLGVRVEWEPYGRPWKSGAVENFHRHSQFWWEGERGEVTSFEAAQRAWREYAWLYTTDWDQRKLGNKPASSILTVCNPWPLDGPSAGPMDYEPTYKLDHEWEGTISFQREVETNGYVKIHGNDHMFVSEMLVGGYVRIDVRVMPKGAHGYGQVLDGKGELCGVFKAQFECNRDKSIGLVYDYHAEGYADSQDVRHKFFDQQAHNRYQEKMQKNQRSASDYEQTGSVPVMRSRKKSAARKEK